MCMLHKPVALARAAASWAGVIGWKGTEPLARLPPPAESSDCNIKVQDLQIYNDILNYITYIITR